MKRPLPQLTRLVLTDGGLETDLIFNHGVDLPSFASIVLLGTAEGRATLEAYYRPYLELAQRLGTGFILESATWRAGSDWAAPLGLTHHELDQLNVAAVELLYRLKTEFATDTVEIVVSGCVGPRGDGYDPGQIMSVTEATDYHVHQARVLASAGADMLSALTMTNVNEATGIALAAQEVGLPSRCRSRWRRTDGSRQATRSETPSRRSMRRAAGTRPISWSTAPIPTISRRCWARRPRGHSVSVVYARTPRAAATRNSTP